MECSRCMSLLQIIFYSNFHIGCFHYTLVLHSGNHFMWDATCNWVYLCSVWQLTKISWLKIFIIHVVHIHVWASLVVEHAYYLLAAYLCIRAVLVMRYSILFLNVKVKAFLLHFSRFFIHLIFLREKEEREMCSVWCCYKNRVQVVFTKFKYYFKKNLSTSHSSTPQRCFVSFLYTF